VRTKLKTELQKS